MPDEDSPGGGDHGGSLSDGVRHGGTDDVGTGGDEIQHRAGAPDQPAENSPQVPALLGSGIGRYADRRLSVQGITHQQRVRDQGTGPDSQGEKERGGIRARRALAAHGSGNE